MPINSCRSGIDCLTHGPKADTHICHCCRARFGIARGFALAHNPAGALPAIHHFQQELGLKLFERVGRGLVLTSEGEQLLTDCRVLLNGADMLRERAQTLLRGDSGVLNVAASPVQIEAVLSTFLHQFARHYPKVQVRLIEAVGPDILSMLERGDVHLGILLHAAQVEGRPFGSHEVPPVELLAARHPLFQARFGKTVEVRALAAHPLLLLDPGFVVRKTFDAVCRLAKLKPRS